jgi:hypothetical protein
VNVEVYETHVAQSPWIALPRHENDNEFLIVNYILPGQTKTQVICTFTAIPEVASWIHQFTHQPESEPSSRLPTEIQAWMKLLKEFYQCSSEFCDHRLKLIPIIQKANWAIKMAVGQKPVLIGTKLLQTYYRGPNYIEFDLDISSSTIAVHILSMVRGLSRSMVVDLGWTIQGETEEELPEII